MTQTHGTFVLDRQKYDRYLRAAPNRTTRRVSMDEFEQGSGLRFAVDMITLYDRELWDVPSFYDFFDPEVIDPSVFWDKALDLVAETGIDGVRLTFGPSHW